MRRIVILSVGAAFLLSGSGVWGLGAAAVIDEGAARAGAAQYVANQMVVKFHAATANAIEAQLELDKSPGGLKLSADLDELNARYRVKEIRPIFKDFKKHRRRQATLLKKDARLLTRKDKHILRRLKRAPKGAAVPALDRIYKIELDLRPGQSLEEAVAAYNADSDVEYAEFNYIVSIDSIPNDPLYAMQWSLNKIDAPEAWDLQTGSLDTIIAVVDTGVDYSHRDLDDNMWTDGSGHYGYDFINNDNDPIDDHGHGTHCAGIIAAEGNNGFDIAGICWNARIMALKFLGANGSGSGADAVEAFYYAVENAADVTSNSWGGGGYMESMQEAINYAYTQGVVMLAAAGNNGMDGLFYPARYDNMISVAATDSSDKKAYFSNYGDWVDLSAPGVGILSLRATGTSMGNPYDSYTTSASGTSMACPHVAGVMALLISKTPGASVQSVTTRVLQTTDDISAQNPDYEDLLGTGRLNAYKAVRDGFEGIISFDSDSYLCDDIVSIEVLDFDLIGEPNQQVTVLADGGDEEALILIADSNAPWSFIGTINTCVDSVVVGNGVLEVSHGQVLTAMYYDVNKYGPGNGGFAQTSAVIDCQPPLIWNVEVAYIASTRAILRFQTDEPTTGFVHCDLTCGGPYLINAQDQTLSTSHAFELSGLASETEYYFVVAANDVLGNASTDDNGGICYSFTTAAAPPPLHVPGDFPTIQAAIDAAVTDDTVIVADGTYTGDGNRDLDFGGKAITVRSENGPENCIIDCQGTETEKHQAFYFHSAEEADSVVEGFTITGSTADHGAIYCYTPSAVTAPSSPTIADCIITNNDGLYAGGIRSIFYCTPTISNCVISGNSSSNEGGGLKCSGAIISNCIICDNTAAFGGGMMCSSYYSGVTMTNCVITGNAASMWGGGIWIHNRSAGSSDTITNCIIRGNSGDQIYVSASPTPSITYCDIAGGWTGQGNIDADPMFVNANEGDYHLLTGSPCINTGDPDFVPGWDETDMDGDPRVLLGRVDMGVDEYTGNVPPVADAGPDQSMSSIAPLIILDGSGSYSTDGNILNYHWRQVGGPVVVLSDVNAVKPTFVPVEFGIYVFELTVDDRIDESLPDTVGIVIGNNHAPIADAGPDRYAGQQLVLDGTGSHDPDGYGALTYEWRQISGPTAGIANANTATPTLTFVQTGAVQECRFELAVSDGDMNSLPNTVKVTIVPAFGGNALELYNPPFDPDKPTILAFAAYASYHCSNGAGMWMYSHSAEWVTRANVITIGLAADYTYSPPYERYGDMFIVYLSSVAPDYRQPIQTIGFRTGGMPAIDVANHVNLTYADARYAVNRVTLLGATCRDYWASIDIFNASAVGGEQCWVDNYYLNDGGTYPGGNYYPGTLNVYFDTDDDYVLVRGWYEGSILHIAWPDDDMYSHGLTAGGFVSVIGPGKTLQLAHDATYYYFEWFNEDPYCSGANCPRSYLRFYDEPSYPGRIPEPVTLVGPADGATIDANGAVLSCEQSENAVGYQLLMSSAPYCVADYHVISDTPHPPDDVITGSPFRRTWWTVRAYDQYASAIYADPRQVLLPPLFKASNPSPADGHTNVPVDAQLSWLPGFAATSHDVYFGTDRDDVNDANTSSSECKGRQVNSDYEPPTLLDIGTTYYWRIDEVNDANTWKGNVWSFTVVNYVVIDDMETYNDTDNKIYDTWIDNFVNWTGSFIGLGTDPNDPVHGGEQAMEFMYDNNFVLALYKYSETQRTFADPCDWASSGAKALTLYFYGEPNNDANATEQMYVGLEGSGSYGQVRYGDSGGDMNDIKEPEWHQWDIDLEDFNDVNLGGVENIYIGFGDRDNPAPGGSGTVCFDDICLMFGSSTCWDAGECAGQMSGDATCDGNVNLADLFALKAHFGKSAPWTGPECCADFTQDGSVNLGDLFILKANFGSGPYGPSTTNQNCPP
ncbi:MAG: S8 family serine peptidase [Planctomycetota bacterium]|jgi:thermitase